MVKYILFLLVLLISVSGLTANDSLKALKSCPFEATRSVKKDKPKVHCQAGDGKNKAVCKTKDVFVDKNKNGICDERECCLGTKKCFTSGIKNSTKAPAAK